MRFLVFVLALVASVCFGQQDLHDTQCPLCAMDVIPSLNQSFKGNQAVYACEMAGHLETLANPASNVLRGAVALSGSTLEPPYTRAHMGCPVCGSTDLKYSMRWGSQGNQKLYTCSKEHADMILADQKKYYVDNGVQLESNGFCKHASVMFDGFQSSVHSTCVKLFFQPWVLNSSVKYAFGFIGIVCMGILLEWLGEYREEVEKKFLDKYGITQSMDQEATLHDNSQPSQAPLLVSTAASSLIQPTTKIIQQKTIKLPLWCTIVLSVLYMIALTMGYLIMLVAMLYETGLFIAAILGLGIGFYLFKETEQDEMSGNIDPCCST
ncbi:transmembrane protein [Thraustotheca clavata]|uniref:Copper transport protein n=1 Tax=Thraustotheca clavata TaxID=74557 RepID=A0A1V9ZD42_9STRA|nr:transmembrane protein [Thraustotheca clavata]